jgi:aryl-phospho-beta-D-glucosidase BglC (GH1 family)
MPTPIDPRAFLAAALLAYAGALAAPALPASDVPAGRLAALSRGVNLSHWFSQIPVKNGAYAHDWFATYDKPEDFALIAGAGFTHVRYPVEFEMFMDEDHPGTLRSEFLPDFDAALDHILGAGLAVIVDWHAREDTKGRLRTDDALALKAAALWGAMARHLAVRDPERVFLETMNEPAGMMSLERWSWVQGGLFAAMRSAAPRHTIIVTSNRWSGVGELAKFTPLADRNVVYNFHFYEPMAETHQGASWTGDGEKELTGVVYPVDPVSKAAELAALSDPAARKVLGDYHASRDWIAARLALAFDWGRVNGVPLTCNEFGVYTRVAPPDSRYRWIRDVRELCEAQGVGWAMWDYAGGFRVANSDAQGRRTLDAECVRALGLQAR